MKYRTTTKQTTEYATVYNYPDEIKQLNPRIQRVIHRYFKKNRKTTQIEGFNFFYRSGEIWIYSIADQVGDFTAPMIITPRNLKKEAK